MEYQVQNMAKAQSIQDPESQRLRLKRSTKLPPRRPAQPAPAAVAIQPPPPTQAVSARPSRSQADPAIPTSSSPANVANMDPSIYTRRERRPSGLPKPTAPIERKTTPVTELKQMRSTPPAKSNPSFSKGVVPEPTSFHSPEAQAPPIYATLTPAKKPRNFIRKKSSSASQSSHGIGNLFSGAGINASTQSLTPSTSSLAGARNASVTPVQGMNVLTKRHKRSGSGSSTSRFPTIDTSDLPPASHVGSACDSSSPSTARYTDSPGAFSLRSNSTAASSTSPGPAAMLRVHTTSPRPPVTRSRAGSTAGLEGVEVGLDPVRESASSSSDSTVKGVELSSAKPLGSRQAGGNTFRFGYGTSQSVSPRSSPQLAPNRRKVSAPTIPARPSNEASLRLAPTGLGLVLPADNAPTSLVRNRSKSEGSVASHMKAISRQDTSSPHFHPPNFLHPPPRPRVPRQATPQPRDPAATQTFHTVPKTTRGSSKERILREPSPVSANLAPPPAKSGLFSRGRSKTPASEEKAVRRGPAAGTGHEGYGPFAKMSSRGRGGSASGSRGKSRTTSRSPSVGRSGSRPASRDSEGGSEVDEYYRDRLKPVVLVGGGATIISRNNSETDLAATGAGMSRTGSSQSSLGLPSPALMSRGNSSEGSVDGRSERGFFGFRHRRKTSKSSPEEKDHSFAAPPHTNTHPAPGGVARAEETTHHASSQPKAKRSIFRPRKDSAPDLGSQKPSKPALSSALDDEVPRSLSRRPAHYALLDQDEKKQAAQLSQQLQKLRPRPADITVPHNYSVALQKRESYQALESPRLAPPESASPAPVSPRTVTFPDDAEAEAKREEVRQAMANERKRIQEANQNAEKPKLPRLHTKVQQPTPVEQPKSVPVLRTKPVSSISPEDYQIKWDSVGLTPTTNAKVTVKEFDFLERPCMRSVPEIVTGENSATVNTRDLFQWPLTVVENKPNPFDSPTFPPAADEDDFWDEYNDLVDEVERSAKRMKSGGLERSSTTKSAKSAKSTASSLGAPFQYAEVCTPSSFRNSLCAPQTSLCKESPTLPPLALTGLGPGQGMDDDIPPLSRNDGLRRQVSQVLTPSTPFSLSSFIRGYGDTESRILSTMSTRLGTAPVASPTKTHRSQNSGSSTASSSSRGSFVVDGTEEEMRVRPWALLASRWLSFDRVLVSPAHEVMASSAGNRILVVDGLGTDDWSFYCALNYPSAKVYNLTTSSVPPQNGRVTPGSQSALRPANHNQIHHPSFATSFPFPKGFFNVVSFRFLPSTSDSHLSFVLTECRRVLQPGGNLEVTAIDADLLCMGKRARRAVDLVKGIMERENERRPSTRPVSERVLRLVQKKGFEDLSQCFVGLPVVGKVDELEPGLLNLDQNTREPSPEDPDAINEVVSKVGRYWYSRCYERTITNEGGVPGRSMWNDRSLLKECSRKKTNFKMLICHARKPTKAHRGAVTTSK